MQDSMAHCPDEPGIAEAKWNGLWNLREMLDDLQGSIYFEKKLSATNARHCSTEANQRRYGQLSIPRWFVKKHGNKFRRAVLLRSGVSNKPWPHRLSFCTSREVPEVTFAGGRWSSFVASNGLVEGDHLIFSLTAMSQFQVYVFDGHGDSKAPQPLHRPIMIHKPLACYNPEENEDTSCQNSFYSDTPESQIEQDILPKVVSCLPSFSRRLVAANLFRLEIPKDFMVTYGSQLDDRVQLQGIHEGSPMLNDVQCICYMDSERGRVRAYLKAGWDDFVGENGLRIEQELVFTLTSHSCFTVREEISWSPLTGLNLGSDALISATM